MLEDQVSYLLQRYLGNYVRGLNREALKISVWQGDVELKNMQLKPEALNALKLPVKVKAGFLGSVKLKVPWSKLGQEPVVVHLDHIYILAEPATQVEGCSVDGLQEVKKSRIREMEMKLLESKQLLTTEMNKSWLGSLINTVVGNLKLSISNIHIRYEDPESNHGHSFAAGITLEKLSAFTIDDNGKETFVTGGALDHIQKSVELEQLAVYLDSDICLWNVHKPWEDLLPSEWSQVFKFGTKDGKPADSFIEKHTYILQPVSGNAQYSKLQSNESANNGQPLQKAVVNLEDVTLCLSKNGYRDLLKLADNFSAFNQRLKYAHYRPVVAVNSDPRSWWKYACKAVLDQMEKASGKLSWEQVLRYATLRKRYISLYASLLKSDLSRPVVDENKELEELDRELDIELILQWRMLAHKFVEQTVESDINMRKQKTQKSWWSFGWNNQSTSTKESEPVYFREEDWEQLNKLIGYKESDDGDFMEIQGKGDVPQTILEVHMKHNASKLTDVSECFAELSCENLDCFIKLYPESKVFDLRLGSYRLSSPNGLLAESASAYESLVGVFCFKPFDAELDWSLVAKASPCYMTYLKDSINQIISFFQGNAAVSQSLASETAAAVQMTFDEVKRTAQQQVNRALKDHARFFLDLDIAAPKITIPTDFCPDNTHPTKLLLDLGNLKICSKDGELESPDEKNMYLQFDLVLSDVYAFLVDGDYRWRESCIGRSACSSQLGVVSFLPVVDNCGVLIKLQQIRSESPIYPSTRIAVRFPSLGFHFSPARYHRFMQVAKIFQEADSENTDIRPWNQADFEGWLSLLTWKGVGNREAVWQRRYLCLVGPYLYILENPGSKSYKQYLSLRGKQLCHVPAETVGSVEHILAVSDTMRSNNKVVEDVNALILRCDSNDLRRTWQSRLQGAIYNASGSAPITGLSESSSDTEDSETATVDKLDTMDLSILERVFFTGVLDELKICFNYNHRELDQSFAKLLLADERRLFEFRATGGRVELLVKENDLFIGTILRSLEIEDLVCCEGMSQPCYVARSFIGNADASNVFYDVGSQSNDYNDVTPREGDDKFYEASDSLNYSSDSPLQSSDNISEYLRSQSSFPLEKSNLGPPSFSRIAGLLPNGNIQTGNNHIEVIDTVDSFVKAQVVIFDKDSPLHNGIDKLVMVTLSTLSFFCRRPMILAIMEFVDAINAEDGSSESFSDNPSAGIMQYDTSQEVMVNNRHSSTLEEAMVVKGLLGKGKSRIIFSVTLNMARAQILLMNENGTTLATLSQNNLLTDIKVFPSSFSIKAALGNLRISDDSLHCDHIYYWACDMRNPGGSSFVELVFSSFSADDEDYEGYDYSLCGQLSEVRIVYLNRFIQEVVSYFMGLVPENSNEVAKVRDQVTNSEKWFTTSEIEGSPAMKLDLSLRKPIILMPRRTDSLDYLKLDVVHITVRNTFQWFHGSKNEMNAVHMETLTVLVEDINLNVDTGTGLGDSIIQDVEGVSIVIRRSLRDLLHQIPSTEVVIKIEELKAAMSNKEYQLITECALSNISETPNVVPPLDRSPKISRGDVEEPQVPQDSYAAESESHNRETWTMLKISVLIDLVELCLHYDTARDASLATMQVSGAWLLYKSNTLGEGLLSASLKGFTVVDDRVGIQQELRMAIGRPESSLSHLLGDDEDRPMVETDVLHNNDMKPVPTMVILDVRFSEYLTSVSLCIQRPQLLVALDFLLAIVEFFVPSVRGTLADSSNIVDALVVDQSTFGQPSAEFILSPLRPLVVDDERYEHFIYDGRGGTLYLQDGKGFNLAAPSTEAIIYVGSGKRLQFKNVVIKNGCYLDSCISLGTNSSYSVLEDDIVRLGEGGEGTSLNSSPNCVANVPSQSTSVGRSTEFVIELQAIGPKLTFYTTSKDVGESPVLSNKLLHAQLDAICRLVLKGDTIEASANVLGLTMESNGIRILEPFDTSLKFSNESGVTNMHIAASNIFMNFSFSILRLFLAVEEDILTFLRMTSNKMTVVCSEFGKVGTIKNPNSDQVYAFWRAQAPPGFAVLGDYLTPLNKPPTKGVLAINTSLARVKKPVSFKLVWPPNGGDVSNSQVADSCSIWFPEAPKGYVALGCVVSTGRTQPALSSAVCVMDSVVSPSGLRDCITISSSNLYPQCFAFWRVNNSLGTFLPADPATLCLTGKAYELRHIFFDLPETSKESTGADIQDYRSGSVNTLQSERPSTVNSERRFEAVASFRLIWWNQGSSSIKKLSLWRPVVPQDMVYFGDIAVSGYEPPNTCLVLHDSEGGDLFRAPLDFQLIGQIKRLRRMESISFWQPQAPPGYVSLGCVAYKGTPRPSDFPSLRCVRSDMVTGDQFLDESIWDTTDVRFTRTPFGLWTTGNELGTFIVRSGDKKPPRRFALKLADPDMPSSSDDTIIEAQIGTLSAVLFDDYGGLMVPLFNVSLSSLDFSLHGRPGCLNSSISFSIAARSFNDKYETWEPLLEPVDGSLRYQYNLNTPGAASQLRLTCTKDLNLNISVSNANMIFQAYASWNYLSQIQVSESHIQVSERETVPPTYGAKPVIDVHHKRNYYIIPQNRLGHEIFIRATEVRGLQHIIKMPSGYMKPLQVPVSKNMLESHLKGNLCQKFRTMVAVIIAGAEFRRVEGFSSGQYAVAIRLKLDQDMSNELVLNRQSAHTSGTSSDCSTSSDRELLNWNEIFFFKVDSPECYVLELEVNDIEKGDPVGYFSAPLLQVAEIQDDSYSNELKWIDLLSTEPMMTQENELRKSHGKLRCLVLLSPRPVDEKDDQSFSRDRSSGFIQISPTKEGPWTTVRLNYAAPATCWRLGNDVVASEVSVNDGNRYVNIRSLVSVRNNTEFTLDICLKLKDSNEQTSLEQTSNHGDIQINGNRLEKDEFLETETYNPTIGWVGSLTQPKPDVAEGLHFQQETFKVELPAGWEWVDDWNLDKTSVNTSDGWIYAPDLDKLKWPESYNPLKSVNYARQRKWVRNRIQVSREAQQIYLGPLTPGETVPLPLRGLTQSGSYILLLRPSDPEICKEFSWSSVVDRPGELEDFGIQKEKSEICVSTLSESEELLYCSETSGSSSNCSRGMWFCLSIQATEIAKDIHSDPIHDWNLVIRSPLSITNYLPLISEFSVLEMQTSGHFLDCSRGIISPGKTVNIYNADIRNPLYFTLLPQRGWLPIHEAVLISHPSRTPSRIISLRSSVSGRIAQIILDQNYDKERPLQAKILRVYSPWWFSIARCPPLTLRLLDMTRRMQKRKIALTFSSKMENDIFEDITEEEIYEGHTIASALSFKYLGLSVFISQSGEEQFGPVKDLSPLCDLDGSMDIYAYNADGNCMQLFISTKTCPYQSVPTKVICIRPFVTFTNRLGHDLFIKLSSDDEPKILHAFDSRVSFTCHATGACNKLQVRLEDTEWSFPVEITKEDTICLVLKKHDGTRQFLNTEIRGYEEGSRFIIVFRCGSNSAPIRIENRTMNKRLRIRQSGFGDDAWIQLEPLSTTNFSWENPYGEKFVDTEVHSCSSVAVRKFNFDKAGLFSADDGLGLSFHIVEFAEIKVARFLDERTIGSNSNEGIRFLPPLENWGNFHMKNKMQASAAPTELVVEFAIVGISIIDHKPKELSYIYLERVLLCYSAGYNGGTTSRFKLILGHCQLDNQLPLTLMPVLLAPDQSSDMHHPVFKMTITLSNENPEGIQVYPYVYIRVTEKCWRLNIHEPIIWALVDFYNNLQLDRLPQSSSVTQVDPEIRVDLIDVSEVRLKVSLETAPAQRPHGVLGVWSPVLSAVGNAFKIQVHLRKVMHRDRFMRRSSVLPSIGNRIWRDLIHNPLHLIFSVDVIGMASSTLASVSKGFAELSTDGQFLQLRSKQVWSRRITGVGDGIREGTAAFAQGVAFGVSGVVRKPVESARQNGLLGLAHGLGRAFLGFIVQPVSGAFDFFSLTVDGIGASCSRCLEVLNNKTKYQRIRNPRAIRSDNILREYCEREAVGQMILYLAEASRQFGCTQIFKEPAKFAWSDYYEDHFTVPYQRIVLVTNKRAMLLQCLAPDKMDKKPCKIMWDVPWEELMALELAKAGCPRPSQLIFHLKDFRRSEAFVRVIKCHSEEESDGREDQAVKICSVVRKMWKMHQSNMKSLTLKVPSSQRHVCFAWNEAYWRDPNTHLRSIIKSRERSLSGSASQDGKFVKHTINFMKVWSSEQESKGRYSLCRKQILKDSVICTIWRPICPEGYVSVGDIAHVGSHPPNVAAVYHNSNRLFTLPMGYDLVWRNCPDDYTTSVSIWHPRAPEGFVSPGCVAVASFEEPEPNLVCCVSESIAEETIFEEQKVWSAPESYPWGCHVYQVRSDALHFVALRQPREESSWKAMRILDDPTRLQLQQQQQK